ncbi:MAG: DNA polymerase I [Bacteroidetes bacterium]|nr:DNA polymerase I [Bacteroidota bacterium]
MSGSKKLFLLDALALIYRAYFAFSKNPRYNSKGMNTSAAFGFTTTLFDLIKNENPSHIAVVFDTSEPTTRHVEYKEYKAQREAMPEDISLAIPFIKRIIESFNIPAIEYPGYEADDIIGTLAKKASKKGYDTYMVTPDKDFGQLVDENTYMYKPARAGGEVEILGVPEILKKWEIKEVSQVIDILGLWGDSVDNIPGIPGIGEKTAKKLIGEYESMENIIAHSEDFKGKLKENIEEFAEQGLLSKRLATIITDVPVDFDEKNLKRKDIDEKRMLEVFSELEFRTLGKRILGDSFVINRSEGTQISLFDSNGDSDSLSAEAKEAISGRNIQNTKHDYKLIDTKEKRQSLIKDLLRQKIICFDTETTGLDPNNVEIVGLSFAYKEGHAFYIPCPEEYDKAKSLLKEFSKVFEDEKSVKIGQNIKYDILVLKWYDIEIRGVLFDTMIAHYLIDPDTRHNMDVLAENYLGYTPVSIKELIGDKKSSEKSMRDVPVEEIAEYASEDADITLQLKNALEPVLKDKKAEELFYEIEMPLIDVLAEMEFSGVAIDTKMLAKYSIELGRSIVKVEKEVYKIAGGEFNMSSPKQLGEILFDKLKLDDKAKKTKTGQYATGEEILVRLADKHDIIGKILDYREFNKLKSTYVDALPKMINPKTGRVHTSFNQAIAATGRLSSVNPNLQNIPIRTDRGRRIREAFVNKDKDYVILSADYSQIELRIVAEISKDEAMLKAFKEGQDIHAATASRVYGVDMDKVTSEMRRNSKTTNFGIIYGISAFGLSQRLNIPRSEAAELIEEYFKSYPNIKKYMDSSIAFAKKKGYVETMMGRRRYLKDINSANQTVRGFAERNAINSPIQGTAADMIKLAMIEIHKVFKKKKFKSRMTLQVHDELVFDAHVDELDIIKPIIEEKMSNALSMKCPIVIEMATGKNWSEAH